MEHGRSDWGRAVLVLICGIFAASQTGKLPPAIPQMREVFGASLVQLGWLASIINLVAALSGLGLGLLADRIGRHALLKAGLLALGIGATLGLLASDLTLLYVSRVIEGVGFVGIVVAAPVLVRSAVAQRAQRLALGIWSTYTAVGMTLMMIMAPWSLPTLGWQGGWWLGVIGAALLLVITSRAYPGCGPRPALTTSGSGTLLRGLHVGTPWWLAAAFGIYTMQWMALMVWMPTFLLEQGGVDLLTVGGLVGLMIVVNVPGNILGGWLAQKQVPLLALIMGPIVVVAVCGYMIFALGPPPVTIVVLGAIFSLFGGILPASIYALVPTIAARYDNLASINGLVVQASNLGMLAGPPLAALLISTGGWHGLAPLFLVASLACAVCGVVGCRDPVLRTA